MDEIEESDVHLCLRCNTHINGLEIYIQHRKNGCRNRQQMIAASLQTTVLQPALLQSTTLQVDSLQSLSSTSAVLLQSSSNPASFSLQDSETNGTVNYIETCIDSRVSVCEQLLHGIEKNKETEQGGNESVEEVTGDIEMDVETEKYVKEYVEEDRSAIEEDIETEEEVKEFVEEDRSAIEEDIETEEEVKEFVEGTSVSNGTIQVTDASECPAYEDYDYSRYLEDKLLGNVDARYKRTAKTTTSKKLPSAKRKKGSNLSPHDDTVCKGESSEDDFRETRNRKYRKNKSANKDLQQSIKVKKNESCNVSDGIQNIEENHEKRKKTVKQKKKGETKSDTAEGNKDKPKSTSKTWTCPICDKVIRACGERVHMRIHSNNKPFKCHKCTYASKTQSDMIIHMKRHLGIKDFKCTECDYASPKRSLLKKHVHRHQREKGLEEMQYQCEECGKRYTSMDGLKLHIRAVHENNKPFRCSFDNCKYAAVSNSELEIHIRTHTKEKPYLCTQCGYKAGNKNRLRRHMITHTDETPFKCDHPGCAFVGKTAFRVRRHKKQHDPDNRLCCPYCSYTTFYLGNLRKHIKNTTKHKNTKVYLCDICKTFNTDVYKDLIDHYEELHKGDVDVTVHSGGLKLGQFNQSRQQDVSVEETIIIIPEEAIVIADNVEFTI